MAPSPLAGADSAVPQPSYYGGRTVWGIYVAGDTPHVWTRNEMAELGLGRVRGVLPIVVPPQIGDWWQGETGGYDHLELLVRQASAWGAHSCGLCVDIEQTLAESMGAQARVVAKAWVAAAESHGFRPWSYGGRTWHEASAEVDHLRWLAEWPDPTPSAAQLPEGYDGWQYAGGAEGGRIDLDIFAPGETYLGCDYVPLEIGAYYDRPKLLAILKPASAPAPRPVVVTPPPPPPPAPPAPGLSPRPAEPLPVEPKDPESKEKGLLKALANLLREYSS